MSSRAFRIDLYKHRLRLHPKTTDFIATITPEDIQLFIEDVAWLETAEKEEKKDLRDYCVKLIKQLEAQLSICQNVTERFRKTLQGLNAMLNEKSQEETADSEQMEEC
jgi:hypothetical protein